MPGRNYDAGSSYRYGFNGQEKSPEIIENSTTALFWEYDARIGRRWNLDPEPELGVSEYACLGNNPLWFYDILGDYKDSTRTKGMNFFVVGTKELRKKDRDDHAPTKGILKGIRAFFRSAYTWDFLKAKFKSFLSFGKLKIIEADNAKDAVDKIKEKLGSKGYIANLTLDYHSGRLGTDAFSSSSIPSVLEDLNKGFMAKGFTTVLLGQCKAGSDGGAFAGKLADMWDNSTVIANVSYCSTPSFCLKSTFNGFSPEKDGYYNLTSHILKIGFNIISDGSSNTHTIDLMVRLSNNGTIIVTSSSYGERRRQRLARKKGI